ncbi:hypothetical protein GQ43DRAFT_459419 [Delitschia confertaspora ATCC 74209]|uniref:SNF2 family N-terminal domain protein n=1 Tax=Delitschia confertaspora ATCC 74209 TaxID=1513339 RepID=A0A9P4JUG7_9PLEO|nr:hypothetical protein GQ43DRAFT_459419 [Delitschia confertaspora ATCC 74209]
MATVSAVAIIQAVEACGLVPSSASDNAWDTLLTFIKQDVALGSQDRAQDSFQKRRRLNNHSSVSLPPTTAINHASSAVVARVCLDLHTGSDLPINTGSWDKPHAFLETSLESFSKISEHEFRVSLRYLHHPPSGIDFIATTSAVNAVAPHLYTAATFSRTKNGKISSRKTGAVFSRCVVQWTSDAMDRLRLLTEIHWTHGLPVVEVIGPNTRLGRLELNVLADAFPVESQEAMSAWSIQEFYENVHVPPMDMEVPKQIERCLADTELYPFQRRAVDWLLRREGFAFPTNGGELVPISTSDANMASFKPSKDADGRVCYVSHLRGMIVSDIKTATRTDDSYRGGILAEEMGLGKTVELIALICQNRRPPCTTKIIDEYLGSSVTPSGATLIITPPSILEQWRNEFATHAPHLTVIHYQGLPAESASQKLQDTASAENLLKHDIVLTTYNVLSREIHHARPPPERSMRHTKQHEPRKSPLVQISWWRVCLDEAQMVESGVSQAATVARLVPRVNAWAVSGTPLRKDIQDLRGLLTFIRYEPYSNCKAIWERLDKSTFKEIISRIAMRHTKDKVREELRLPPQKRFVITVPFTRIEEQNYSEMVRQMCDACGLSEEGVPIMDGRDAHDPIAIERMREWLVRLRQTCLHAHVGRKNKRALGAKNPLRTVDEVLEIMIDQNDTLLKSEAREFISAQLVSGHIIANAKNIERRTESALTLYQEALKGIMGYIKRFQNELRDECSKIGYVLEKNYEQSDDGDTNAQNSGRILTIRKALRSFQELEHICRFSIGTCYFQIKSNETSTKPDSEDFHWLDKLENDWYEQAKAIRRQLLKEPYSKAQYLMSKIQSQQSLTKLPRVDYLKDRGGIENRKILEAIDDISDLLNAQATQLEQWREKVVSILRMPLVDQDEGKDITGDEYEDSTKAQDELYIYIMALRTIVADRNHTLNGSEDPLIDHEMRAAGTQAREGKGHAPELVLKVAAVRRDLKPKPLQNSLKGIISAVRSLVTSLHWQADGGNQRARSEALIVEKQLAEIQKIAIAQTKATMELEKELELFRVTMNQRLEFYRHLQHVSDAVRPWREKQDDVLDEKAHKQTEAKKLKAQYTLQTLETKQKFLINLRRENQTESDHSCLICLEQFDTGVLTVCGHAYCKECINQWWKEKRTCPKCRKSLHHASFHDIVFKPRDPKVQEEMHNKDSSSQVSSPNTSIYSEMNDSTMKEIKDIRLDGTSYSTKIDMIAKHLIWIRRNDPGAKSVIFSQFGDFLEVLKEALNKWKIGCSSISNKGSINEFKMNPAIDCFLLDAKSDASGLTLVNATYVFLAEPMINVALELQAIARVHRIGQQRPTTVFMYLVSDTVEQAIYNISVSRRLEHMGRSKSSNPESGTATLGLQENILDAANSMELEKAPLKRLLRKKGDGEVVPQDDLWTCLFSKRKQRRPVMEGEVERHLRAEAVENRVAAADVPN